MILSDVFERSAQVSPLTVMARGLLENALNPEALDQLVEDVADQQYTKKILFSSVVDLMGLVVCGIQPAINAAYRDKAETLPVTIQALYGKLDRTGPVTSAALVRTNGARLAAVIDAMGGARAPSLPGYNVKLLDGNHLAGTEHRIKELRIMRAGARPGQALVVLDPERMLAIDVILCEDGRAQERSLLDQVLELVRPRDLWIEDRNFGTTAFLFGIARRDASFIVRQHASTLHWEFAGKRRARGRSATGKASEQRVRISNAEGEILFLRRITVALDTPTRDGDAEIHLLTNIPAKAARAGVIAELYRRRWTIETAVAESEATLNGEINTLGYPKAAWFAFCVASVSYNVLSTIKAALRSVHGEGVVAKDVSGSYVAHEIKRVHDGMMIAIPEDEWVVFHERTPEEMAAIVIGLARAVRLPKYKKNTRGPKRPQPAKQSGAKIKHVATSKILEARKVCTT